MGDSSDEEMEQTGETNSGRNTAVAEEVRADPDVSTDQLDAEFEEDGKRGEEITEMVKNAHDEFRELVKAGGVEVCRWDNVLDYWQEKLMKVPPRFHCPRF